MNGRIALVRYAQPSCSYPLNGRDDRPVLMLSHSLGQDHGMWAVQADALSSHFRVLQYDIRGHGASEVVTGDYRIEQLGADALALAAALGIRQFAFCGLSLGGMIGIWLAIPERVTALVPLTPAARGRRRNGGTPQYCLSRACRRWSRP